MPRPHQEAFLEYVVLESPSQLLGKINIDTIFSLLLRYLHFSIVKPALYLSESWNILQQITLPEKVGQVGFAFESENIRPSTTQLISPQIQIINEFLTDFPGYDLITMEGQFQDITTAGKFETLFKNSPLPLTLR
jgi:hypothetical protein